MVAQIASNKNSALGSREFTKDLRVFSAAKQTRDQHQEDRSYRCGRQAVNESAAKDAQLRKNPAAKNRAHQPNRDVPEAPETRPAADLARDPARQQPDNDPSQQGGTDRDSKKMNHYATS